VRLLTGLQNPDAPFNLSDTDPMSWIFKEDFDQGFLEP
jgi:hypothetical protein